MSFFNQPQMAAVQRQFFKLYIFNSIHFLYHALSCFVRAVRKLCQWWLTTTLISFNMTPSTRDRSTTSSQTNLDCLFFCNHLCPTCTVSNIFEQKLNFTGNCTVYSSQTFVMCAGAAQLDIMCENRQRKVRESKNDVCCRFWYSNIVQT